LNEQVSNKVFGVKILENTTKSRFRKKHWILWVDLLVTLIILLVIIILLRHKPSDYSPQVTFEKEVSPYLTNKLLPQFYNGMQRKEPFELAVEQKGLNEAIESLGWPQMFNGLIISTPTVAFAPQHMRLMAMVNYNNMDTVVTVEVTPQFDASGMLSLQVEKVKMGAMSITYVAKKLAKKMYNEQISFIEPDNIVSMALSSVLAEKPFKPVFDIEGKRAKIDKIMVEKQLIRIHIVPIDKAKN
jgi:hypothetical protein